MRVLSLCSCAALALGFVISGTANAQNYFQDFSATFPILGDDPGLVTIVLENESGDVVRPFVDFPVPGLTAYTGRPQVAARTGGATASQEVGAISSTYTLGAVNTDVLYDIDPLPETGGNGVYSPDVGILNDDFITLSEDDIADIQSAVAWGEAFSGDYELASYEFDIRISGTGTQENDQADGMGFAYLNSSEFGTSGVQGPGISEEPNFVQSLGVGFDIYNNGCEGGNSISLHYNNQILESVTIDPGTVDPNTGEEWEFNFLDTDEVINAKVFVTPGTDVGGGEPPELKGGSPYSIWNKGCPQAELVQVGGEGSMEGHLSVAPEAEGASNVVAFDYDGSEASDEMVAAFNFRGLTTPDSNRADGMSFLLVPTDDYGETGADQIDFPLHEEPNLAGALGIAFDTFNNDTDAQDDPEEMPDTGNHVSVHFDGEKLTQVNFELADFDIVTDDPEVWHRAEVIMSGDNLTVVITDGADGSQHIAFDDQIAGLGEIGTTRPAFAARTGGAFDSYEIDNFSLNDGTSTLPGDYNNDGVIDAADADLQSVAMKDANPDLAVFDENGDGAVNVTDRNIWVKDHARTWLGDANLDGEFESGDFVVVFTAGLYDKPEMAGWAEGDWNGDMLFESGDFVAAFTDGGYNQGKLPAAAAVPEPSSCTLALLCILGLAGVARRRRSP